MYILSASVQRLHLLHPHRPGEEKGHAKAGLTPPHSAPPLPAQATWPLYDPIPPNPGDQGAESRGWVCLILLIGFNLSLASFSSSPCWVQGLREGWIYAAIFIHSLFRVGRVSPSLAPSHPPPLVWASLFACFLRCGERCLIEPSPLPWSPGVWDGGGICLKRHFTIIKSIFTKLMLGSAWAKDSSEGWVTLMALES